ncbi:hypothetical protein [Streptomyces sp. NBC_01689]|uniref:hypothetical protein n=1 Tax=Streptomyces sp. NBC_01689 TaxID=2975911 RepID=UPI002E32FC9E|nr:hypothetical protein [Streptomyces sp. NBC_01689]
MSTFYPRATRRGAALDWVKFDAELARDGSVDTVDKALYVAIGSFVDAETRESPETFEIDPNNIPPWVPTRKRLAECIGKSVDTVDRSTKRLETRGLLRVHRRPDPTNPRRMLPSEYELLDHHIWDERAAQRAAERVARRAGKAEATSSGGGRTDAATPGRMDAATPGRTGAAVKDLEEVVEEDEGELAPSARSAADARRASAGSSAYYAKSSGSAATRKAGSSSVKGSGKATVPGPRDGDGPELSKDEAAACREVEAGLPALLVKKLPFGHIPTVNRPAVLAALQSRTPQQLADRAARRWLAYRYEPALHDGELRSPVGAALELIAPTPHCRDLSCEDGFMIDTGEECRLCVNRRADRRADRLAGKTVRSGKASGPVAAAAIECHDCGRPFPGAAPADGVCKECHEEAAATAAALSAKWSQNAADRQAQEAAATAATAATAAAEQAEHQEQERKETEARRAEEAMTAQQRAEADETARVRAQLARDFPDLAAVSPSVAQGSMAPF